MKLQEDFDYNEIFDYRDIYEPGTKKVAVFCFDGSYFLNHITDNASLFETFCQQLILAKENVGANQIALMTVSNYAIKDPRFQRVAIQLRKIVEKLEDNGQELSYCVDSVLKNGVYLLNTNHVFQEYGAEKTSKMGKIVFQLSNAIRDGKTVLQSCFLFFDDINSKKIHKLEQCMDGLVPIVPIHLEKRKEDGSNYYDVVACTELIDYNRSYMKKR